MPNLEHHVIIKTVSCVMFGVTPTNLPIIQVACKQENKGIDTVNTCAFNVAVCSPLSLFTYPELAATSFRPWSLGASQMDGDGTAELVLDEPPCLLNDGPLCSIYNYSVLSSLQFLTVPELFCIFMFNSLI